MTLHQLKPNVGSRKSKMRVGRGNGSGKGTYSGRGIKGQTARAGGRRRPGFSGGQIPLTMRMPKLGGFRNPNRVEYNIVNVGDLEKIFSAGDTVTAESLRKKELLTSNKNPIKILGNGTLTIALTVNIAKVSKNAEAKITKAGGKIEK